MNCPRCGGRVFFTDPRCLLCGTDVGYDPQGDGFQDVARSGRCANWSAWACNWVPDRAGGQCVACALDRRVSFPGLDLTAFQAAKRRAVRQLLLLGLDLAGAEPPLAFELLRPEDDQQVTIGHADGLITLDVSEGDPAQLVATQVGLGEPYRTPLGHVRHEAGHWHWQSVVARDPAVLAHFRDLFGDERVDYGRALEEHYGVADDGSWREHHISHYAAAHPWEDYAESFAHVLHMVGLLETAAAEGFLGHSGLDRSFLATYAAWAPLTVRINELARSMGTPDPYPFAPPAPAVARMGFVYNLLMARARLLDA